MVYQRKAQKANAEVQAQLRAITAPGPVNPEHPKQELTEGARFSGTLFPLVTSQLPIGLGGLAISGR